MLIMSLGCLQFSRESCLLYAFLLGYLPSIFCDFGEKPIDFYLQDSLRAGRQFFSSPFAHYSFTSGPVWLVFGIYLKKFFAAHTWLLSFRSG